MRKTNPKTHTCADCVHESACRVWTSGRVLADENAAKCPAFETIRDTAAYLIGKMEAHQKSNRDWLNSLSPVELVNWIKNTAAAMSHAELLRWMEEKHENLSEQKRARN